MTRLPLAWRLVIVGVSWVVWPYAAQFIYWFGNVLLATGRRCSIEGCTFPTGSLWFAYLWFLPVVLTYQLLLRRQTVSD
jgi:hypothetical protein